MEELEKKFLIPLATNQASMYTARKLEKALTAVVIRYKTNSTLVEDRIMLKRIGRRSIKNINFAKMYGGRIYGNHMRARKTR